MSTVRNDSRRIEALCSAARVCTGHTGVQPPDNWELLGDEHLQGRCVHGPQAGRR